MLADLLFRLRSLVRRGEVEQELDEELRAHLEHEIGRQVAAGVSPSEARRRAHLALGGVEQVKEQCRDARGTRWFDEVVRDLHYALRLLRRSPGFATIAVVLLPLGIGANTAIFTLLDAVILRPLPVRSPAELVSVGDASRPTALWEGGPMLNVFSHPLYERLRDGNRVFTGLLASGRAGRIEMSVGDGNTGEVRGRLVSDNYFDVLGVSPFIGRTFSAGERTPGAAPVIVISHDFWATRFARDAGVLGRTVRLNGSPFTVVGVGPLRFTGEVIGSPADVWIPLSMQPLVNPGHARLHRRDSNWLLAIGRLKAGVSLERARADMTMLAHDALIDYTGVAASADRVREIRRQTLEVQPGARGFSWIRKNRASLLLTFMVVVSLVLVIACANVANLLLARASSRQKEISVRLAVGASRWRVTRQLLTEGAVLAALGGIAGLLLAQWGSRLLSRLVSVGGTSPIPFDVDVYPNVAVLAFTAAVSVLTAILFALVPAVRATRVELSDALKDNARSLDRGGWSLSKLLVVAQVALSLPLLIGAGLFARSLANLDGLDVGYSRDNLTLLKADLPGSGYATTGQQLSLARPLIDRLRSVPGVLGVTVSENGLFSGANSSAGALQVEGSRQSGPEDGSSSFDQIGPRYFKVIGVPILAGREFDERDIRGALPVAIINETMARFYFGEREALGKVVLNGADRYTIVGVVKDSRQHDLQGKPERRFFIPLLQTMDTFTALNFAIRTRDDAATMIPVIRRELQLFDRNLKVMSLESARALMHDSIRGERSLAQLSGFFGILALVLAAAGLYGVMSYATSRRANEIGLRMALGADRGHVIRMILRETLVLVAGGFAIGLPAALAITRLTTATLTGVSASDPATVAGATVALLMVSVCAGLIPAQRASRIDPMAALRQE